ncbi:sigma factor [Streptomyces sp. NPDC056628]|uniref:sigma factor n=1 Tax=Streptomyces sp. NPDC056628 TaxID=3345882 RepID=UPI0036CC71B7
MAQVAAWTAPDCGRCSSRPGQASPGADLDVDVDDIVQDTMVAVIRALPDLRNAAKVRLWLVAIAVRQLTDTRRRAP